jgi:hypothetical protein
LTLPTFTPEIRTSVSRTMPRALLKATFIRYDSGFSGIGPPNWIHM